MNEAFADAIGEAVNLMMSILIAGAFAVQQAQVIDQRHTRVFNDLTNGCTYVVGINGEGLHVIINGGEHCHRILIDGARVDPGRRT